MTRLGVEAWGLGGDLLYSGIGQSTALLLRHLPEVAPDVEVVAYCGPREPRPGWLPGPVEWRRSRSRLDRRLAALDSRLRELPGQVRRDGVDVFHAPGLHVRPSFPPVPRLGCPVVATVHDAIPLTFYGSDLPLKLRAFHRWNFGRALGSAAVVTVSDAARREIKGAAPRATPEVIVIPNAVEFAPRGDPEPLRRLGIQPPYVLFAGSYEPRKNLAGALAAMSELRGRGVPHRLVAVVERASGHAPTLHALIAELGLRERVHLVHSLSDPDLRSLYTQAELLLFPSLAEGFGLPPLQAAACGVPVVASDLPAVREVMGDGAQLVDPRSPSALAEAMACILTQPGLSADLVRRSRRRLAQHHPARYVGAYAELYRSLVRG
ncbi:MAG: glycosyltransferase family 4 protein [Actinobacteria bacterium]|nr:glycosyltransferase family 4 protein [Actinomycetota bacterium]